MDVLTVEQRSVSTTKSSSKSTFNKIPKSATYTADSIHTTLSDKYNSKNATRESIDETKNNSPIKVSTSTSHVNCSSTWTREYTKQKIEREKTSSKAGWDEMMNLEQLFQLQMIDTQEYNIRKNKIINAMTGTKVNKETQARVDQILRKRKKDGPPKFRILGETKIIKTVPKWGSVISERAIRHSCIVSAQENTTEHWVQDMRMVKMAHNPFNNGTLRYVYYVLDVTDELSEENKKETRDVDSSYIENKNQLSIVEQSFVTDTGLPTIAGYNNNKTLPTDIPPLVKQGLIVNPPPATHVAKISIEPIEEAQSYFQDVAMQKHAQRFADEFNKHQVPKKVGFLDCWVYELVDRSPHVLCGVEKYIGGEYIKYTNNWSWVNTVDRNTPLAFSHYTYEASEHKILICDLQGVNDIYTDPQMHTHNGKGCGKGNMGQEGIDKFLSSHKCNALCSYLKLTATNPQSQVQGTLPNHRYMRNETITTLTNVPTQYTIPDTTQCNTTTYTYDEQGLFQSTLGARLLPKIRNDSFTENENDHHSIFPRRVESVCTALQSEKRSFWCSCVIL